MLHDPLCLRHRARCGGRKIVKYNPAPDGLRPESKLNNFSSLQTEIAALKMRRTETRIG
jgi:hypothetical protein